MDPDGGTLLRCHGTRIQPVEQDPVLELLRSLVIALLSTTGNLGECAPSKDGEEVLLDKDADGYRYLLLRTRLLNQQRTLLSPREQEIARMVASGYPSKTIASILNISCWTVGTHLRRIYAKLGVNTRAAMVDRLHETRMGAHARASSSSGSPAANVAGRRSA